MLPEREGHVRDRGDDAGDERVGGVHQQLGRFPVGVLKPALEIPRNEHADDDFIAEQHPFEFLCGRRLPHRGDHLRRRQVGHQPPRRLGAGLVRDAGAQVAHVHVDRVAEERDQDQRDADDHGEGQAVACELPELLQGNGQGSAHGLHDGLGAVASRVLRMAFMMVSAQWRPEFSARPS